MSTAEIPQPAPLMDPLLVLKAMEQAAAEAVKWHQRLGNAIAVWRDGRVQVIRPEDIVLPPDRRG